MMSDIIFSIKLPLNVRVNPAATNPDLSVRCGMSNVSPGGRGELTRENTSWICFKRRREII